MVQRMAAEGHELGNHGHAHKHHKQLDLAGNREEIRKADAAIRAVQPGQLRLFAPPYGEYSSATVEAARDLGYQTILWSIDTVDWKLPGVQVIISRVLGKAHNGALVLMHPTAQTVEALPAIISGLKAQGYALCTVSEVIE